MSKAIAKPALELAYTDKKGKAQVTKLRAQSFGGSGKSVIRKQEEPNVATSNAEEEDFDRLLRGQSGVLIQPPFDLRKLVSMDQISTELGQDVDAMVTNTVGFGWSLKERRMKDDQRKEREQQVEDERFMLDAHLETVHPRESFTGLLNKVKQDKHLCGNGYLELIDNNCGDLVAMSHVHGHTIRLTVQDKKPTKVAVPRVRPDKNFAIEEVPMFYRFRRFVQMRNRHLVWFKEAGDPRQLDVKTGEYAEDLPLSRRATSLLHFSIYDATSPYGIPLWIGNTFSVFGSREADETNYVTLLNNAVPSMFCIVENGALTDESIKRLSEWVESQIQQDSNMSKFILLEGESLDDGAPNPAQFRIRIEPLKQLQQTDQMFTQYNADNRDKIRQSFRLPPIFVGRSDDYNRATADTSRDIADEQVFAPERMRDDHLINRFVLSRWDARFHMLRHRNPNITDDIELIRLMAIAEKSGAMTPRRADRIIRDVFTEDLGPMPTGVDLDTPFTLSFAAAQQGATTEDAPQEDQAQKMIDGLLDLRSRIEKEMDSRWDA